jgi:ABC-type amino acid transport substrate-binding protein
LSDAAKGKEGIMAFSKTAERLEIFDFGQEVMFWDELVLVVRKGKEFPFETLDDLRGKRVGIPIGGAFGESFDKAVREKLFTTVGGAHPAYQLGMLAAGRLDAVLVSFGKAGLNAILESNEYASALKAPGQFVVLATPLSRDPNYLAFAKTMNRKALLADVDKALRKGYQNGSIPALIAGYSSRTRLP